MHSRLLLPVLLALTCSLAYAAVPQDLITSLPGYGMTPTPQYSGYLEVDKVNGRFLHYWFVTAETNASAPLVLWLNGGPGCSSLEYVWFRFVIRFACCVRCC